MYGETYEKITVDSFKALEEPSHQIAQVCHMDDYYYEKLRYVRVI